MGMQANQTTQAGERTQTLESTYDAKVANRAMRENDRRLSSMGFRPLRYIPAFQKSIADGKGDLFHITRTDGVVTSITREFDATF